MNTYLLLLRGINIGGKNKVPMAELRLRLERLGYLGASTHLNSGNVIMRSDKDAEGVESDVERLLPSAFDLDSTLIRALALTQTHVASIVNDRPRGFGDHPDTYYSDVIFLMGIDPAEAMTAFNPREGVDQIWPGKSVIYSQRLTAERTRSRLNTVMASPMYQSMTLRSWSTTLKLWDSVQAMVVDEKAES